MAVAIWSKQTTTATLAPKMAWQRQKQWVTIPLAIAVGVRRRCCTHVVLCTLHLKRSMLCGRKYGYCSVSRIRCSNTSESSECSGSSTGSKSGSSSCGKKEDSSSRALAACQSISMLTSILLVPAMTFVVIRVNQSCGCTSSANNQRTTLVASAEAWLSRVY